jgi:hypothetical protein
MAENFNNGFSLDVTADQSSFDQSLNPNMIPNNTTKINLSDIPHENMPANPFLSDVQLPNNSEFNFPSDIPLPQSSTNPFMVGQNPIQPESYNFQPSLELPESQIFSNNTNEFPAGIQPGQNTPTDLGESGINLKPEDAMNTANNVASNLDALKKDVQTISQQVRNPDPRIKSAEKENFDEKVTITPGNLIFENRKNKMSTNPEWA